MKNKLFFINCIIICLITFPGYTLDKNSICNKIISDPDFDTFLNLREFFRENPSLVETHNPDDETYCNILKIQFSKYPKKFTSAMNEENVLKNCLNLNESDLSFEYESFKRLKYTIRKCHL